MTGDGSLAATGSALRAATGSVSLAARGSALLAKGERFARGDGGWRGTLVIRFADQRLLLALARMNVPI
jgi:hypothetical protein